MDQRIIFSIAISGMVALSGCSSGGSSSSGTSTRSYTLPTEISAVPATTSTSASLLGQLNRAATDLSSSSDYKKEMTAKYVEEHALDQFAIIDQVMKALAQTHYDESANQTGAPYKVMVAWEDKNNGVEIKKLEPWVVTSEIITGLHPDGTFGNINRARAWILEDDTSPSATPGSKRTIRAEFKIYSGATFDTDGSVLTYGEWDLNVSFNSTNSAYFVASSRVVNGVPELKINDYEGDHFSRAVLYRSGTSGYGKVEYPDYSSCMSPSCVPGTATASYAYNADYLAVQEGSNAPVYKDRASKVEMTHRYGLFYTENPPAGVNAGEDIQKYKSFGFPVSYVDTNGFTQHAYYGAWQGRHQLWSGNPDSTVPAGTTVTREDRSPTAAQEQYTVSATFNGSFTKRTLVDGSPDDIQDIVVETFTNKHYDLFKNSGTWQYCDGGWIQFSPPPTPPQCMDFSTGNPKSFSTFSAWTSLVGNSRKHVFINRWDNVNMVPLNYVYLAAADGVANFTGAGLYPATQGQNGLTSQAGGTLYTGADGDQLGVDINGSIYIQYTGDFTSGKTGWVQKKLTSFDETTWTPTFDAAGDTNFAPEQGREYYINSNGVNYVVKRIAAADAAASYQVQLELQTTANPSNYSTILPVGTDHLSLPWQPDLKLKLETNSASANFLKLVYAADDPSTVSTTETSADVYTSGQWGLQAYNASNQPLDENGAVVAVDGFGVPIGSTHPVQFNWEYSSSGGFGAQQYLLDSSNNYKLLSDPVTLTAQSFDYSYRTGVSKTLALQFDGWMHGLPDLYQDLQSNNFSMTTALSQKIINIPAGTAVTGTDSTPYYIKPLEMSIFLSEVVTPAAGKSFPDVTQGSSLDVSEGSSLLPSFTDHGMSTTIPDAEVKYSEGNPV